MYADALGQRYDRPDSGWSSRVGYACRHDLALVLGGLPVLLVFVLERVAGLEVSRSATLLLH